MTHDGAVTIAQWETLWHTAVRETPRMGGDSQTSEGFSAPLGIEQVTVTISHVLTERSRDGYSNRMPESHWYQGYPTGPEH